MDESFEMTDFYHASAGVSYGLVSECVCICYKPVLYWNGCSH